MKIFVKAKTGAKKEKVEKVSENVFIVCVKELPIEGKANLAIIRLLAEYFNIAKSRIEIISGETSKKKMIEIS